MACRNEAIVKRQLSGGQVAADEPRVPRGGGRDPGRGVPALAIRALPGGTGLLASLVLQQHLHHVRAGHGAAARVTCCSHEGRGHGRLGRPCPRDPGRDAAQRGRLVDGVNTNVDGKSPRSHPVQRQRLDECVHCEDAANAATPTCGSLNLA